MDSKTMLIASCLLLFTILGDKSASANKIVPKLYEEIGCKEITDSNGPTRFDCPDFSKYADDKCYLKGKIFNESSYIDEDLWPSCQPGCRCVKRNHAPAHIDCVHNDCPEFLGAPRDWSCVQQYKNVKDCCRSQQLCDKARIGQLNKCVVNGKEYRPGEKIYPEDDSCYHCLCAEGYNNQTSFAENPHCEKIDCHMELNHWHDIKSGCTPVYRKTPSCCPFEFKCPSDTDTIDSSTATQFSNDANYSCKFGNLTLKHGEQLKTDDKCLKCKCSVPPFVTCIQLDKC